MVRGIDPRVERPEAHALQKIYCGDARWERSPRSDGFYWDTQNQVSLEPDYAEGRTGAPHETCRAFSSTAAWTQSFYERKHPVTGQVVQTARHSQITLCEWYLLQQSDTYLDVDRFSINGVKSLAATAFESLWGQLRGAQIDHLAGLDHLILHEVGDHISFRPHELTEKVRTYFSWGECRRRGIW